MRFPRQNIITLKRLYIRLENQSRTKNIRIDGIREEEAETWDKTETKEKEIP